MVAPPWYTEILEAVERGLWLCVLLVITFTRLDIHRRVRLLSIPLAVRLTGKTVEISPLSPTALEGVVLRDRFAHSPHPEEMKAVCDFLSRRLNGAPRTFSKIHIPNVKSIIGTVLE